MKTISALLVSAIAVWLFWCHAQKLPQIPADRSEVVFWHFWGGEDRDLVEDVVRQFNESQNEFYVRAVAMPGNNLQAKLFLSVAGGDPPDLVNQDDPVIPDWAHRGVIQPLENVAIEAEVAALREWWLPAAKRLSLFEGQVFGICNGLDIRALYYNQTMLENHGLEPPNSICDLDRIAEVISPPGKSGYSKLGYLPDSRRLMAWQAVFGAKSISGNEISRKIGLDLELDSSESIAALRWMASYRSRYGADQIAEFRKTDQSLPGGIFPLLPFSDDETEGRYAVIMDGQWRVRNIKAFQEMRRTKNLSVPKFGVCPLPAPVTNNAKPNAGWVNGNFFVVPSGAKNPRGAWAFAKFWIGVTDRRVAADTCRRGGWIPVSRSVISTESFQAYLNENPMFRTFVELANSPNQHPTPPVVGAGQIKRALEDAGYRAMYDADSDSAELLHSIQSSFGSKAGSIQKQPIGGS